MGMETAIFAKNDEAALIIMSGILLMLFMGITLLLFFYFSKKKIVQKELEKKNIELQHSKDLLESTIAVQETERKRIAQDLHDEISSKLNVVSLNCHLLLMNDIPKQKELEVLSVIVDLSSKALENSRRIAHNLFPPVFEQFGLHAAIEELCREFNTLNEVKISYENKAVFDNGQRDRQMHVFRILQELVNNSIRHGKATEIAIAFEDSGEKTCCAYIDNGKGFDMAAAEAQKGLGMKNIQSRISYLKGELAINSTINKGVNVNFSF